MKVYVGKQLVRLFANDCPNEISEYNGEIFDKDDRHFLHRTVGKLADCDCLAFFGKSQKELQELISSRNVYDMLDCGLLQICSPAQYYNQCKSSTTQEARKGRIVAGLNKISDKYYLPPFVQTAIVDLFLNV